MSKTKISALRRPVYQSLKRRADILLDLIDALTVAGQVSSPVALSEPKPFRRKFGSVWDGLENGAMEIGEIFSLLPRGVPEDSETIAGYNTHAHKLRFPLSEKARFVSECGIQSLCDGCDTQRA